ncbi:anti-sigma factor [Halobacillus massiliensis]|uniref:anti-sigma factor n=1 Tax=Halobacillus massiliensis TaxID=1926286 RepID=UPI0009E61450|nr:anti-sigma factor [Halobacillus massiliensis]
MSKQQCDKVLDYLNNKLTDQEKEEYENHLRECPECQEEVKELEEIMGEVPYHIEETEVPSGMKSRVLGGVFEEETEGTEHHVIPSKPAKWKLWAGALAAGLLLSIGGNIFTGLQLQQLSSQNDQLESTLSDLQTVITQLEEQGRGTVSPLMQTQLASTGEAGQGIATMVDQEDGAELLVQVNEMTKLEEGTVYQVWLIEGENPEPAGAFTTNEEGNGAVTFHFDDENLKSWDSIAVTVEQEPNNPLPQGDIVLQAQL